MPGGSALLISSILAVDRGGHRPAVAADQHQRGADHDLLPVVAGAAGAQLAPDRDLGDVLHPHRHAAAGGDDDLADLLHVLDPPGGAHDIPLAVALDIARAAAGVVALQRLDDVAERQAERDRASPDPAATWYCLT